LFYIYNITQVNIVLNRDLTLLDKITRDIAKVKGEDYRFKFMHILSNITNVFDWNEVVIQFVSKCVFTAYIQGYIDGTKAKEERKGK